jgi:hypothetical protein
MVLAHELVDPLVKDAVQLLTEARYIFADQSSTAKRLPASSLHALFAFRFFSLLAHAVATACLLQTEPLHARASMGPGGTEAGFLKWQQYLHMLVLGSLVCLTVDAGLLTSGVSLGKPRVVLANGCFHSLGAFFTLWSAVDAWGWHSILAIFALFTFPPFAIEVLLIRPVGPIVRALSALLGITWRYGNFAVKKAATYAYGCAEFCCCCYACKPRARYARTPDDATGP